MDFESLISTCYSFYNERQTTLKTLTIQSDIIKYNESSLHYYRTQLEPYIFNYLIYNYGKQLDNFWKSHQFLKNSKYAFVIVERRPHPNWWFILRNIAWVAPHFSLYIFCSDLNYDFIKSLLGDKADNVNIIKWYKGNPDRDTGRNEYTMTFKLGAFYRLIDAEYMITVQMDSYFLQKIPDWIFTGTYYGAPWIWNPTKGGNGGVSIRNIKDMIEICEKEKRNIQNDDSEDWHFSKMIEKYNYSLPSFEFRSKVIQENFPTIFSPIGIHQFWTYLDNYNISNSDLFKSHLLKMLTINI